MLRGGGGWENNLSMRAVFGPEEAAGITGVTAQNFRLSPWKGEGIFICGKQDVL